MSSSCPTKAELTALLVGELPAATREALEHHLADCAACRQYLDLMAVGDGNWLGDARAYVKADPSIQAREIAERFKSTRGSPAHSKERAPDPLLTASEELRRLGDYEILSELGRGGMGVVFKAHQQSLHRDVALKVILAGQLASEAQLHRFRLEAEAVARLDHPNIVPIYEIGEHEGRHFFSMKLIEGASLKERRAEFQALSSNSGSSAGERIHQERKLARLMADIARGVHHAHQRGVLHRDLKPANVLIDAQGQPHLTDFGLAKLAQSDADLTLSRMVMGTPEYMSPEQATGQSRLITTASDVYSLGAMLYELLAGQPPFQGDDALHILNRVVNEEPKPPRTINLSVSRDLEIICLKCLEKEPSARHRSAEELAEELERISRGESIHSRAASAPEKVWRWCKRKPALAGALGGLVFVFILGFAGVAWKWRGELHQRQLAEQQSEQKRQALTRLEMERAEAQFKDGNSDKALAYLARLVRREPTNRVAIERLMNALSYRSFGLPVAALTHGKPMTGSQNSTEPRRATPPISGSTATITSGAFSPDGRLVVTSSLDGTVRLWESDTGRAVGEPLKHDSAVLWAEFSPDGKKLVTCSQDGTARIWDVEKQRLIAVTSKYSGALRHASFHPDGTRFIIACDDGTARVLEVDTGQSTGKIFRHDSPVYYAAFSPDGNCILTAEERPIQHAPGHVWDANTGAELAGLPHQYRPESRNLFPGFSPSGNTVLVADGMNAFLFGSQHAGMAHPKPEHQFHHDNDVIALRFSPDGQFVATGAHDATARIWSATNTQKALHTMLHKQSVNSVQFGADERLLLTASSDRTARLWDRQTGEAATEPFRHQSSVLNAVMTTNRILTVSETDTAWLWNVPHGMPPAKVFQEREGVDYVRFSPDGKSVASLNHEGISLWNVETQSRKGGKILQPRVKQRILDMDFSPDGKFLATALEHGHTLIWNLTSLRPEGLPYAAGQSAVRRVRFSPDSGRMVTVTDDGAGTVWKVGSRIPLFQINLGVRANYAEFDATGARIVVACWDGTARVFSVPSGKPLLTPLRHDSAVHWARFDPAGTHLVTASRDKTVRIWSANDGTLIRILDHADALAESYSFDFSVSDGSNRLATGAGDTLQIWDINTGKPIGAPIRHGALLLSVRFSPDGKRLVTASNDGTAWVWDASSGQQLSEPLRHGGCVTYSEFSPNGKWVVTGSSVDDQVRVWPVIEAPLPAPGWVPELAEALAGQCIHENEVSEVMPVTSLFRLRQHLQANTGSNYYDRWARWFFADWHGNEAGGVAGLVRD